MLKIFIFFLFFILMSTVTATASKECIAPELENGLVSGTGDSTRWVGTFSCKAGFVLAGRRRGKCREGVWNSAPPVCTGVGMCDAERLPKVKYSRLMAQRGYRGSVYKYTCMKGYKMYGQARVYCDGENWDYSRPPVCSKPGCNEDGMSVIRYGSSRRILDGSVYRFVCEDGSKLLGPDTVFCDGTVWNDSAPVCQKAASPPSLSIMVGESEVGQEETEKGEEEEKTRIVVVDEEDEVSVHCKAVDGNPDPTISILINQQQVGLPREFRNTFTFKASASEHGMEVRCEAKNSMMEEPAFSALVIRVRYAALSLEVSAPEFGLQGSIQTFICVAGPSFPETQLYWKHSQDLAEESVFVETDFSMIEEGFVTTSTLELRLPHSPIPFKTATVSCEGYNGGSRVLQNFTTLEIYEPPSSPEVAIYIDGSPVNQVNAGDEFTIECKTYGGNPDPSLALMVGSEEVVPRQYGNISHKMTADRTNMYLEIKCSAKNAAIESDQTTGMHLDVMYPSATPTLNLAVGDNSVSSVITGDTVTVSCGFNGYPFPGNPLPFLSLGLDQEMVVDDQSTDIIWTFQAGPQHLGSILECSAVNSFFFGPSISKTTLEVIYPPEEPTIAMYVGEDQDQDSVVPVWPGDKVTIQCGYAGVVGVRGYPDPLMSINFNGSAVVQEAKTDVTWSFIAAPEDVGAIIECISDNTVMNVQKTSSIQLNVLVEAEDDSYAEEDDNDSYDGYDDSDEDNYNNLDMVDFTKTNESDKDHEVSAVKETIGNELADAELEDIYQSLDDISESLPKKTTSDSEDTGLLESAIKEVEIEINSLPTNTDEEENSDSDKYELLQAKEDLANQAMIDEYFEADEYEYEDDDSYEYLPEYESSADDDENQNDKGEDVTDEDNLNNEEDEDYSLENVPVKEEISHQNDISHVYTKLSHSEVREVSEDNARQNKVLSNKDTAEASQSKDSLKVKSSSASLFKSSSASCLYSFHLPLIILASYMLHYRI